MSTRPGGVPAGMASIGELADAVLTNLRARSTTPKDTITMTEVTSHTDPALRAAAEEWLQAKAELEKLSARVDELADELRAAMQPGDRVELPNGVVVGLRPGATRFDPRKAQQLLTPEQLATISEPRPVAELAKRLHPALLAQVQTRTRPSVVVL